MGRNREPGRKTHPTSFWLDDETKDALNRLTQELNLNRSAVVREAIQKMASKDKNTEVRRLVAELQRAVSSGATS